MPMNFEDKVAAVSAASAVMNSSKVLCLDDAKRLQRMGDSHYANQRLEKAAQYAWGGSRPSGWNQ